jgi:hypothetical protein
MNKMVASSLMFLALAVVLAGCVDASRERSIRTVGVSKIYTIDLSTDHQHYESGEPVQLRAAFTNVSEYTLTFGSESEALPAIDVKVNGWPSGVAPEERTWSQENQAQVKTPIVLAPRESYVITWTLSLSYKAQYRIDVLWTDPSGHPPNANLKPGRKNRAGLQITYGIQPPGPMP